MKNNYEEGQGFNCPICNEYQASDDLRYHPAIHGKEYKRLFTASLEDLFSFYEND